LNYTLGEVILDHGKVHEDHVTIIYCPLGEVILELLYKAQEGRVAIIYCTLGEVILES
jgi:hypothetical protein